MMGLLDEITNRNEGHSPMNVDNELASSVCNKRPREADDADDDAVGAFHSAAAKKTTHEDDVFVSGLFGAAAARSPACRKSDSSARSSDTNMPPTMPKPQVKEVSQLPKAENASVPTQTLALPVPPVVDSKIPAKPSAESVFATAATQPMALPVYEPTAAKNLPLAAPTANGNNGPDMDTKPPAQLLPEVASLPSNQGMVAPMFQPNPLSPLRSTEKYVQRWTCDVCKCVSFDSFDEANAHEIQCRLIQEARAKAAETALRAMAPRAPLSLLENRKVEEEERSSMLPAITTRTVDVNLAPTGSASSLLSDYNNLLVRNIEFYFPSTDNTVGLRCIHCKDLPTHVAAASFAPGTISSISTGLGTIGTRHFGWGKCPAVKREVVSEMIAAKKSSNIQTRHKGRVGLDAYCRNLAKQYGIVEDEDSGIRWIEGTVPNFDLTDELFQRKLSTSSSRRSSSTDNAPSRKSSAASATSSVLTTSTRPSVSDESIASVLAGMKNDLNIEGDSRPFVPSEAAIVSQPTRTSGRRTKRRYNAASIKQGVDDVVLCVPEDQKLTTEFAFFVVTQLKRCYLTKEGGSRKNCPLGSAGLACGHCAGTPNERRFFYTSADHLRNSFSHIPSHMAECSYCPAEVKARIEELKAKRNKQKNSLGIGHHKMFIDRVWERLFEGVGQLTDDDTDSESEGIATPHTLSPNRNASANNSQLVLSADRTSTTDLAYLLLLNLEPYQLSGDLIGFPGLVCKHCMKRQNGRKFFTTSSDLLSDLLLSISDHMVCCKDCPAAVRAQISSYKKTHDAQIQQLQEGEHSSLMNLVWKRLTILSATQSRRSSRALVPRGDPVRYQRVNPNQELVTKELEKLVTPFTALTMRQVIPCNLEKSGNGTRSTFDFGFPGLECRHCAGQPNSRRFFYRSSDILTGNYAHIPNHILACSYCPQEIKEHLKREKEVHNRIKHSLPKGNQRMFFDTIWNSFHVVAKP